MDIKRTKQYYKQLSSHDLCDCAYCQNYIGEIKSTYPKVAEYLFSLGIDIEKPFETMPLEPDETGYIEYISPQYIAIGSSDDFVETTIDSVNVGIAESHPSTQIGETPFVIEVGPVGPVKIYAQNCLQAPAE